MNKPELLFSFSSSPVKSPVDFGQLAVGDVSVNLGGSDAAVAQKRLDRTQICPSLQQVRGKAVADNVGRDFFGNAGLNGIKMYESFN